jgi:hypothetical protein
LKNREMAETNEVKFYLNPIAQYYLAGSQLFKILIAGRGFGKSHLNGVDLADDVEKLPRAKTLFLGKTYTQIYTNTIMPITAALETLGYMRDIHYVIGKKPPKGFAHPYQKPERYENVMTFWNGYTVIMGSFDRPQLLRGGSNDGVKTDEALLIDKDKYDEVIIPTLRPSSVRLMGKPKMLHQHFTTSMPYGETGRWLFDYEEKAKREVRKYLFVEGTSWHNRKVIGDDTILRWKETMSPVRYQIEILNKRIFNLGNKFYKSLSEGHFYDEEANYDFIDGLGFDMNAKRDCRWDNDCLFDKAIDVSFDFGNFSCMWVAQEHGPFYKLINTFHTEDNEILDDIVERFCEYYAYKMNRVVNIYGDKMGKYKGGNTRYSQFQTVERILIKHGFRPNFQPSGDIDHLERHDFINQLLRHENKILPAILINRNKCSDAKIALETAGMIDGQKDKRSERHAIEQKHATHYTDALDYLLYPKFRYFQTGNLVIDRAGTR